MADDTVKTDSSMTIQKAAIIRMRSRFTPAPALIQKGKRKPLYTDEEAVEDTQRRMARMNIGP
jgi:hypothetical protein